MPIIRISDNGRPKVGLSHLTYDQARGRLVGYTLCGFPVSERMDIAYCGPTDCPPNVDEGYRCGSCWRKQAKRIADKLRRSGVKTQSKTKTLKLKNCHECPHATPTRTPGAGYAVDYFCKLSPIKGPLSFAWQSKGYNPHGFRVFDSCIEWDSEKRKDGDFPEWCPL